MDFTSLCHSVAETGSHIKILFRTGPLMLGAGHGTLFLFLELATQGGKARGWGRTLVYSQGLGKVHLRSGFTWSLPTRQDG